MSDPFAQYVEFLKKLGFKLVGEFTYDQLDPNARERCSSPPCSVSIEIPSGRVGDVNKVAIVVYIKYASNTELTVRRVARCQGQEITLYESRAQVF